MGCWVETCMVTGLPIRYPDPVIGFLLLIENQRPCGRSPTWMVAEPISLPLRGTYDDYGGLEFEGSPEVGRFTERCIQSRIVNPRKKLPDLKTILHQAERATVSVEEGLLLSSGHYDPEGRQLGLALIHPFAFELALERVKDSGSRPWGPNSDLSLSLNGTPFFGVENKSRGGYVEEVPEEEASLLREAYEDLGRFDRYLELIRRLWIPQIAGKGAQHTEYSEHAILLQRGSEFSQTRYCKICGGEYCEHMEELEE